MINLPYFYTIRFECLPHLLYIGKVKENRSREARWSEHSVSFQKGKAAPNLQKLYDQKYKVVYGRVTYQLVSLPTQEIEDMEKNVMSHAISCGYTLLNTVGVSQVKKQGQLDRVNTLIYLNVVKENNE